VAALSFPAPEAGLVIRYSYLWKSEFEAGREEGVKDRPCAIITSVRLSPDAGDTIVMVAPITHSAPQLADAAIEIPSPIKKRLGLDNERSWIVATEINEFKWPGPDLRPQQGGDLSSVAYGFLPPTMFRVLQQKLLSSIRAGTATRVPRTE
jgi:hypothetical protein